jgi:serine protease AprX
VLAVGADNPGTDPSVRKDAVADFSSRGNTTRHPDLLAPGTSVLGLRDPGSAIDLAYPTAAVGDRFFKGSGTSQAAAVTSGAVALLLSKRPTLTPDQVKKPLTTTAAPISGADAVSQGAGVLDVNKAAIAATPATSAQPFVASTGLGSLEAARGGAHVQVNGKDLTGEKDAFGKAWTATTWAAATGAGTTWTGGAAASGSLYATWAFMGSSLAGTATSTNTTSSGAGPGGCGRDGYGRAAPGRRPCGRAACGRAPSGSTGVWLTRRNRGRAGVVRPRPRLGRVASVFGLAGRRSRRPGTPIDGGCRVGASGSKPVTV